MEAVIAPKGQKKDVTPNAHWQKKDAMWDDGQLSTYYAKMSTK